MPYALIADDQPVDLGDRRYLLSPQDLAGVEMLPDLIRRGVASLKIEGRLKTPEYVANITRVYREALDQVQAAISPTSIHDLAAHGRAQQAVGQVWQQRRYDVEMSFSRGLFTGWMQGINNQQLVHARFGKKRGVYLGRVVAIGRDKVDVALEAQVKAGDGIVFDAGRPELEEEGGRVHEVRAHTGRGPSVATLRFGHGVVDVRRLNIGDRVWKTSDPDLDRRLRQSFADGVPRFRRPVDIRVQGSEQQPLVLEACDDEGHVVQLQSRSTLIKADRHPLDNERLRDQIGRLGGTPFYLRRLDSTLSQKLILPVSELNGLRRDMVAQLERLRARPSRWSWNETVPALGACSPPERDDLGKNLSHAPVDLIALVRTLEQLEAALKARVETIYCDFENPKSYRDAVGCFRSHQRAMGPSAGGARSIFVAPPRIS
jgi:putative protease